MDNEKKNKKSTILLVIGVITLIAAVSGATYAFFIGQGSTTDPKAVDVTTASTDLFTLNIENELSLTTLNQTTMADDATSNQSTSTLATATLKANNVSDATPQKYYMYLIADVNPFVYTKDSDTPELLLKLEYNTSGNNFVEITDNNKASYPGVTLEGLTYKTVNGGTAREVSGWDITTPTLVKIIENKAINAAMNTTTIDKYRVTITFVNLVGHDQQDNTNKTYYGQLLFRKGRDITYPQYWNNDYRGFTKEFVFPNTPSTTYGSLAELRDANEAPSHNRDFADYPIYIKTTETGHQACLYYNNKEFCMINNYWDTDVATTKAKLKADMENSLGVTIPDSNCSTNIGTMPESAYATCRLSNFNCIAYSTGNSSCYRFVSDCAVYGDGYASCD